MNKKEEILEAAYKHFSKRGYNVSMVDIAKEVGIKPPSIYSHFSSKDEILYLTVEREILKYTEFLNKTYDENKHKSLEEDLKNIFFSVIGYYNCHEKLRFWKNILLIDNDELRKNCSELVFNLGIFHMKKVEEVFAQSIFSGEANKDELECKALLFLAMIQGVLNGELLCKGSSIKTEEFILKTWQSYWNGILNNIKDKSNTRLR